MTLLERIEQRERIVRARQRAGCAWCGDIDCPRARDDDAWQRAPVPAVSRSYDGAYDGSMPALGLPRGAYVRDGEYLVRAR